MSARDNRCVRRTGSFLLSIAFCCASAQAQTPSSDGTCRMKDVPVKISERPNADTHLAPRLKGGETVTVFTTSPYVNVLRNRRIIDQDPTTAKAWLSDGSGLQFHRDCRGMGCVYLGLKTAAVAADCWPGWARPYVPAWNRNSAGAFDLNNGEFIAVENTRRIGRLILRTVDDTGKVTSEPLLVTARSIVGYGVTPQALHGPFRNIHVIKHEADGSLSLAAYTFLTTKKCLDGTKWQCPPPPGVQPENQGLYRLGD